MPIDRKIALAARPAAQVFTEALAGMRRVLKDDAEYLAMLVQVEGWIVGQRSWLQGVADANSRERVNGDSAPDSRLSLPLARPSADTVEPQQREIDLGNGPAVGAG